MTTQSTRLIITFNNPLETLLRIQLSVPEIDQESANKVVILLFLLFFFCYFLVIVSCFDLMFTILADGAHK